jgi:Pyridine nucleotide-disulphide oxidoreductase
MPAQDRVRGDQAMATQRSRQPPDERGEDGPVYVQVDEQLRTSAAHVFAAGDITGRLMLVPQAVQDGYLAATNAVQSRGATLTAPVSPIGSFTDPEYAQVGLTEAGARQDRDVVVAIARFAVAARPIIDGRPMDSVKSSSIAPVTESWDAMSLVNGRWNSPRSPRSPSPPP